MDLVLSTVQKSHGALVFSLAAAVAGGGSVAAALLRPAHETKIAQLPAHAQVPLRLLARFRNHGPSEFDAYLDALLEFQRSSACEAVLSHAVSLGCEEAAHVHVWDTSGVLYAKLVDEDHDHDHDTERRQSGRNKVAQCLLVWTRIALGAIAMDKEARRRETQQQQDQDQQIQNQQKQTR
jgi:hypothetical protein